MQSQQTLSPFPEIVATESLAPEDQQQVLQARARLLARPRLKQPETTGATLQVVQFLVNDETYAFDAIFLREVYRMKECTRIPGAPSHVLGVINVRGLMVALIDLHLLFGLPSHHRAERDQVLIVQAKGKEVGILTDGTLGMRALPVERIHPVPPMVTDSRAMYLRGVANEHLVIINMERVLFSSQGVT